MRQVVRGRGEFGVPMEEEDEVREIPQVDIEGPLALWVGLVAVAAIFQIFIFPALQSGSAGGMLTALERIAGYALYVPGILVLPVLAGLWIGSRAGSTEGKLHRVASRALMNALYVSVVYLIEMFIFYIISSSMHAGALYLVPLSAFAELVVALPIVVCVIVAPLFAMVSAARRY